MKGDMEKEPVTESAKRPCCQPASLGIDPGTYLRDQAAGLQIGGTDSLDRLPPRTRLGRQRRSSSQPRPPFQPRPGSSSRFTLLAVAAAAMLASGCSSGTSTSGVAVAPIAFTDANGTPLATAPTTLTAGQSSYVDVQLSHDPQGLGAEWSVYCGSALPAGTPLPTGETQDTSCGSFVPAHTLSGPIPSFVTSGAGYVTLYTAPATPPKQGVVTLYAAATSSPGKYSSVTLTILGHAISVSLAPAPPATLAVGATTQLRAVINNDATNAGVTWSAICAATDCGSFNPASTTSGVATTYTAPAAVPQGGSEASFVQIMATSVADPTKTASATVSITAAD